MTIHAKKISLLVTLGIAFAAADSKATPHPMTVVQAITHGALAQATQTKTDAQSQADDLLAKARKAMSDNRLDLAEYYLVKVERLGVTYGSLSAQYRDTPASVRRELDRIKQRGEPSESPVRYTANRPSSSAPPALDPFATRNQEVINRDAERAAKADSEGAPGRVDASSARPLDGAPDRAPNSRAKTDALRLTSEAKFAFDRGDVELAQQRIQQAVDLNVPDREFGPSDMRPWDLKLKIDSVAKRRRNAVEPANQFDAGDRYGSRQAQYDPDRDATRNRPAQSEEPETSPPATGDARRLFELGMRALGDGNPEAAKQHFEQSWKFRDQLDPETFQTLQDKLVGLAQKGARESLPPPSARSPLEQVDEQQQLLVEKIKQEIFKERAAAENMKKADPRGALDRLKKLHGNVTQTQIDPATKNYLLNLVDRRILDMERYIDQHATEIENEEINRTRLEDVENRQVQRLEVDNKLAMMVEQFNELIDENRFAEAEVIARQALEIAPNHAVVQTLLWKSRFARRFQTQMAIQERGEAGFLDALEAAQESSIPFDDRFPIQFGDATEWGKLTQSRTQRNREMKGRLSQEEIRIQQALRDKKIDVRFTNRPLSEVLEILGATAGVNVHLDQRGLIAEGRTSDEPVTLVLNQPISLKSALNLILDPLKLSYVVQNEVIKVTSEQLRDENVYPRTFYVADLVIPIPNFVPSYNIGLPGAIAHAHNAMGMGGGGFAPSGSVPLSMAANRDAINPVTNNPQVLANMSPNSLMGSARSQGPVGYGPGGLGGGPVADFDSLIELITTTVAPETWDEVGGPGSISGFETNLSLVVSQTQEVHDQLADLLEQLRRLQDLQVTIEVRFITLNDNFFERIGIDFDFEVNDNSGFVGDGMGGFNTPPGPPRDDGNNFTIFGLDAAGNPTGDLDLTFGQGSFGSAVPQFGGFDAATAANIGFAILSDIEVFFLLQASTGDTRSNVMQAPKVTLFNGQFALVSDTSQRPFVTSVIPVVGDFAAAQQPVIVVLNEGTSLSVQAVVTADRRFVRLTLVPFFSSIGEVREFTFTGKKVANTNSPILDANGNPTGRNNTTSDIIEGTTVQLPTFNFTTITTTVSVPDGGTVLLGGIKRLSEGRNERGVPLLAKMPYINRLFKNVGIGRTTQSLMMMVTPRIIIQEEEELRQTGLDSSKL